MKTKNKVRFCVIGCGNVGAVHINAIREMKNGELVAVCDGSEERAKKYASLYGIKAYAKIEEMLLDEEIDAVTICTPSGLHKEQALLALAAGKHVIVEKPMALNTKDAKEIATAAEKSSKSFSVVFQMRYSKDIQYAKRIIDNGELGKLLLCNLSMKYWRDKSYFEESPWRGTFAMDGGGALMNQGIHGIDIMHYLLGAPRIISAKVKTLIHNIEVEDTAVAIVEYPSGALGIIEAATSISPGFGRKIEIHGEKGYLIISEKSIEKLYIDGKFIIDKEVENSPGSASDPTKLKHEAHLCQFENFANNIFGKEELLSSAKNGYDTVATIEKIYEISKMA